VLLGLGGFIEPLVEVGLDGLLADGCPGGIEQQRRNRVGACRREQRGSGFARDGHLVDE
jgi:hypothetical protein